MAFVIKAEVYNPSGGTFAFHAQKTMYGGKDVATGDTIFVFASENEGGQGLIASGEVTATRPVPKKPGIARQTPRVSFIDPATANLTAAEEASGLNVVPPSSDHLSDRLKVNHNTAPVTEIIAGNFWLAVGLFPSA